MYNNSPTRNMNFDIALHSYVNFFGVKKLSQCIVCYFSRSKCINWYNGKLQNGKIVENIPQITNKLIHNFPQVHNYAISWAKMQASRHN